MTIDEARTTINNWKAVKSRMNTLATKSSKLPDPDYINVFGWRMLEDDSVMFYFDITCGASDKREDGVVVCTLEDIVNE